jgi:hypothetical protein
MSEAMKKKTSLVLIAAAVFIVAIIVWFGGASLGRWLLAMHGKH